MNNKNNKYKFSSQREKIIELLKSSKIHPTANSIYDEIKKDFPNISMGTVYRNLNVLIEMGLVNKLDFGSTFDRFEYKEDPHYHFICNRCGKIMDIDIPKDINLTKNIQKKYNVNIKSHRAEFYGICQECQNKK